MSLEESSIIGAYYVRSILTFLDNIQTSHTAVIWLNVFVCRTLRFTISPETAVDLWCCRIYSKLNFCVRRFNIYERSLFFLPSIWCIVGALHPICCDAQENMQLNSEHHQARVGDGLSLHHPRMKHEWAYNAWIVNYFCILSIDSALSYS